LFGCGLSWASAGNPGGDQDPAELDEHVLEGGLGLGAVPGLGGAAVVDVGGVVAVPGVPADDQRVHQQGEGDGALDGAPDPVAGLAGAQDVAGVGEGLLDAPAGGVTRDERGGDAARSVVIRARSYPLVVCWSRDRISRTVRVCHDPYHRQVTSATCLTRSRP